MVSLAAMRSRRRSHIARRSHVEKQSTPESSRSCATIELSRTAQRNATHRGDSMQEMDQRDRELVGALQAEIPLVSTPFAFIGQALDLSEKEVIKRTERLRREGFIRHLAAQFHAHAARQHV